MPGYRDKILRLSPGRLAARQDGQRSIIISGKQLLLSFIVWIPESSLLVPLPGRRRSRERVQTIEMTPDGLLLAALGSALFPSAVHAAVQCYSINGTRADDSHAPCDPDAEVSACCALNKSRPDICLSSGLCYAQDVNYHGLIYSNGCTDPTGQADECPHLCPDRMSSS